MPITRLLMLLALCWLTACTLTNEPNPPTQLAGTDVPPLTTDEPAGGDCFAVNTTDVELEIYSPDDIGTVIGLLAPGERIRIEATTYNAAAPFREGWLVVNLADAGQGYLDPNVASREGACDSLPILPTPPGA